MDCKIEIIDIFAEIENLEDSTKETICKGECGGNYCGDVC